MGTELATAPLCAVGLIAGFGVAVATGSRALGGVVLACFGLWCIAIWLRRDGRRTAARLTVVGLLAFALSHVLGLVIGAWPAVLVAAAATAAAAWRLSDVHRIGARARART
jgi:thiol:disulfide interchange protein